MTNRTIWTASVSERLARAAIFVGLISVACAACADRLSSRDPDLDTAATPHWCALAEPVLEIGPRTGTELYRVAGAHRLRDRGLVIANAGTLELLFFDADGRLTHRVGGAGAGPGEFRDIGLLAPFAAESLLVFDPRLQRVTILDRQGMLARTYRLPRVDGDVQVEAVRSTGTTVGRVMRGYDSDSVLTGIRRPEVRVLELTADGEVRRDLGAFPGDAAFLLASAGSMIAGPLTFGATLHVAATDSFVVVGSTGEPVLHVLDGTAPRSLPIALGRLPAGPADFHAAAEQYLAGIPAPARRIERARFDVMPRLDSLPHFAEIAADAGGRIWVRRQLAPGDGRRLWVVLDGRGEVLANVRLPDETRLLEAGAEHVVLAGRTTLDEEYVRTIPLVRAGCASEADL